MIYSELFWNFLHRWWRLFAVIIFFALLIVIFFTQTIIVIHVNKPTESQDSLLKLTSLNNKGQRSDVFYIGNIALIARDTDRIEGEMGIWKTSVDITPLPWLSVKEITINIDRDRNVEKVSGGSLGCIVYDEKSANLASYTCSSPNGLYVYRTTTTDGTPWKNEPFLTFPQAYFVTPYNKGLLGIENSPNPKLFYANMSSKNVTLPKLPSDMNPKNLSGVSIVTDAIEQSSSFLLVDNREDTIYFATDDNGTIKYQKYTPNVDWVESGGIRCKLQDTTAYCYVGSSSLVSDEHEHEIEENEIHANPNKKHHDGRLIVIEFKDDQVSYSASIVSKNEPIDELYIDDNGKIFAKIKSTLYNLDISRAIVKQTVVASNVSAVTGGKSLYYIADNQLYEFDSKTKNTYMRFMSHNLRLSVLNQYGSQLFINAYIQKAPDNTIHTYRLLNEQNVTPGDRLVDKLPVYPDANQTPIVNIDYYKNTIHIVLPDYVTYDKKKRIVPDEKRFASERQRVINDLSIVVPKINSYSLTFSRATNL